MARTVTTFHSAPSRWLLTAPLTIFVESLQGWFGRLNASPLLALLPYTGFAGGSFAFAQDDNCWDSESTYGLHGQTRIGNSSITGGLGVRLCAPWSQMERQQVQIVSTAEGWSFTSKSSTWDRTMDTTSAMATNVDSLSLRNRNSA